MHIQPPQSLHKVYIEIKVTKFVILDLNGIQILGLKNVYNLVGTTKSTTNYVDELKCFPKLLQHSRSYFKNCVRCI